MFQGMLDPGTLLQGLPLTREALQQWLYNQLNNEVLIGLVGAGVLGAGAYLLRRIPSEIYKFIKRKTRTVVTVENNDRVFNWLVLWLSMTRYARNSKVLKLETSPKDEEIGFNWTLSPGYGHHLIFHKKHPVILNRFRIEGRDRGPTEGIEIILPGGGKKVLRSMLNEAWSLQAKSDLLEIYRWQTEFWRLVDYKVPRSLDSIILPPGQMERVIDDLQWFRTAEAWYNQRGIPYRRGYLLSGPPGTGKTSMIMAMAYRMELPLYYLNYGAVVSDNELFDAFSSAPRRAVMLIEDIDAAKATANREIRYDPAGNPVIKESTSSTTLSGLLNVLDGAMYQEGRIFFMTTNHPGKLDQALMRPGRIDLHERLDLLGSREIAAMLRRFYGTQDLPPLHPGLRISPARVQVICMRHQNDPLAAMREISGTSGTWEEGLSKDTEGPNGNAAARHGIRLA
jgi:chaperone BCS1